jgi:hypothetical protein
MPCYASFTHNVRHNAVLTGQYRDFIVQQLHSVSRHFDVMHVCQSLCSSTKHPCSKDKCHSNTATTGPSSLDVAEEFSAIAVSVTIIAMLL